MTSDNDQTVIETEFAVSWDGMEQFFTWHSTLEGWEWLKPISDLMTALRKRGYDRKFRAGQSLWRFVISRSRQHGLRPDQSCVSIELHRQGGMTATYYEGRDAKTQFELDRVEITPELESLLQRLLAHPID